MTVTKDRHLTLVDTSEAADRTSVRLSGHARLVYDVLDRMSPCPDCRGKGCKSCQSSGITGLSPGVLEDLAELDADHATALDVLDLAAADVDQARRDLTEAARRLADAEERWARAGIVADEANRAVIAAREAAGLALTASGYRRSTP